MKKEETTQIVVTPEAMKAIESRVNGSNKFSRDEIELYREQITLARKAKRERLGAMAASDVSNVISKHMEAGFVVKDTKQASLKTGDKIVVEFFRAKKARPKPKSISEMSVEEILDALGDKGGAVASALLAKIHAGKAVEVEVEG